VINLLQDLQEEYELSYLFIAHDLSVVRHISDRIAVMYLGQVMEMSDADSLFGDPKHPYTQALLSAIPHPNPRRKKTRIILEGDVPSPINPPSGCVFHTRCPACFEPCNRVVPKTTETEPGRFVKCHLYDPEYADPALFERLPDFRGEPVGTDGTTNGSEAEEESESVAEAESAPEPTEDAESGHSDDAEAEPSDASASGDDTDSTEHEPEAGTEHEEE
jgi:oligopeptide/dipeptide ABC transporter ATP-binding protein